MSQLNVYGSGYLLDTLNINQNLNIKNYLRVYEVLGVNNIQIYNFGYIKKDLNLFKDISILNNLKYPIINIKNSNTVSLIVNNDLNCYYYTTFNNLYSLGDINITLNDNYKSNIKINSNINVANRVISDIKLLKKDINESNTTFTKNIIINKETILFDCDVFRINCNNYTTHNIDILNNANCNKFVNIKINNKLDIGKSVNIVADTFIEQSLFINGLLHFSNNSIFILPKLSNNINYTTLKNGSIRYNDIKKTIEYYDSRWKSISSFHSSDYNTSIIISENNNTNTSNNITFYKNSKINIELNNNTYNVNIYKNLTKFNNNLNINGIIKNFPNNIQVNDLILNKNTFINNLLILENINTTSATNGSLRFNKNINTLQLYNNGWGKLNFYSNYSGINVKDNDTINIFYNKNSIILNNNIYFNNNINIFKNINNFNNIKVNSTILDKNIIFNNKAILRYFNNNLEAYVAPNYNTNNINNYKFFDVNDKIENNLNIYYTSNIYYSKLTNYFTNLLHNISYDNIIETNIKFQYICSPSTNILINKFEIKCISEHTNLLDILLLNTIKNSNYIIKVYNKNNIIYDSNSSANSFLLEKNINYTIQIKSTNIININTLVFVRLLGLYYSDIYYNNNIDFLYKIDNKFKKNVEFLNNVNINKNININKTLITNIYNYDNLFINTDKFDNSLLKVNNILNIKNNNIGISTSYNNNNTLTIKTNINKDTFNVNGNAFIVGNINVTNVEISNNCNVENIIYNNLNTDNIIITNTNTIKQNINCENLNVKNINSKNNYFQDIFTNSLVFNNETYKLEDLLLNKTNILNSIINFNNNIIFDNICNIGINTNNTHDAFTIGNSIKPNLAISHNGYTILNTTSNGFLLENVNVFNKLENIKYI